MREPDAHGGLQPVATAALLLLTLLLTAWSWQRWPDVQVDFGRELYVPWRLTLGDHLHADIAWFNGPLSAWWNALWFRVGGASILTLSAVNLTLLLLALYLIVDSTRRWAGATAGLACGLTFLSIFAFGRYAPIGNYNFIAPYSHELTHGLILGLASLACLSRAQQGRKSAWTLAAGLLLGMAALTKAEASAAGAVAALTRLALGCTGVPLSRSARRFAVFMVGLVLPIGLAYLSLSTTLGAERGLHAVLGSWLHLGNESVQSLPFYRSMLGLDSPGQNARVMFTGGLTLAAGFGAVYLLSSRLLSRQASSTAARSLAAALGLLSMLIFIHNVGWREVARSFPLLLTGYAIWLAAQWIRQYSRSDTRSAAVTADTLSFTVFSVALLAKMALAPRLDHYGFALAVPATCTLVALCVGELPARLERRGRGGAFLRTAALGGVAALCVTHLVRAHAWHHGNPSGWRNYDEVAVGSGGDRILARWRGAEMAQALAELDQLLAPEDTLLVLPEGVMLNYLLRRENPTPYLNFMPPELLLFGEQAIIDALEAAPPDVIAVAHKDTSEYGLPRFGTDYAEELWAWVQARYVYRSNFGAIPLISSRFGVGIMVPR